MHEMLIKEIVKKGNSLDMLELENIMNEMLKYIKTVDKEKYKKIEYKMYKIIYGEHISEELAESWVDSMENKDGTHGAHWTYEQTSQYARNHDKWDWYVTMNMVYSDYYTPKYSTDDYANMANDFLNDKDVGKCKLLRYYWYVVNE